MPRRPFHSRPANPREIALDVLDVPSVGVVSAVVDADGIVVAFVDECPSVLWCDAFGPDELLDILDEDEGEGIL